jgi:hypothetical protein
VKHSIKLYWNIQRINTSCLSSLISEQRAENTIMTLLNTFKKEKSTTCSQINCMIYLDASARKCGFSQFSHGGHHRCSLTIVGDRPWIFSLRFSGSQTENLDCSWYGLGDTTATNLSADFPDFPMVESITGAVSPL